MFMYKFNSKKVKDDLVKWIENYFNENGKNSKAVVGISGGKDSSVVAALCVEALGKGRVFGVLMPQNEQSDISYSYKLCDFLGINYTVVNIGSTVDELLKNICIGELSSVTTINTPARIRMATLYAISGTIGGRVANTCNLSEDFVGYATKFGDGAGDFSPLSDLTVSEVKEIGRELNLPEELIEKVPTDGLCGKTDEDNLGFTYEVLDKYINYGVCDNIEIENKIKEMNKIGLHKINPMPKFVLENGYYMAEFEG